MKYLLDTDHCIALAKKNPALVEALRKHPPSKVRASSISLAELHYGASKSTHPDAAKANLRRIFKTLLVVPFDEAAAEAYGSVRVGLEKRGAPVGLAASAPPVRGSAETRKVGRGGTRWGQHSGAQLCRSCAVECVTNEETPDFSEVSSFLLERAKRLELSTYCMASSRRYF